MTTSVGKSAASAESTRPDTRTPRRRRSRHSDIKWALVFIFPSTIGFLAFYAWPTIRGFYLSFTKYNILQPPEFIGLRNYEKLTQDPQFWNSVVVTLEYVLINVTTLMIGGLAIAVIMDRLTRSVFVRVTLVFPWLVPNVAIGVISLFMLDRTVGVVNHALTVVNLPPQYFYQDPHQAIMTIALVNTWRNVGFTGLLLFAGMQLIPKSLYEAASIDGANEWVLFRRITMPLLRPIMAFVLTVSMVGSFQIFDTVSVAYKQPIPAADVLGYHIYQAAFAQGRMGYASAMAICLLAITSIIMIVQFRLLRVSQSDLS